MEKLYIKSINKKYKHAKVRGNSKYVQLEASINNTRYRFATGLLLSEENLNYVERNYLKLIEEYNNKKAQIENELKEKHKIKDYGIYVLKLELANMKNTTRVKYENVFKLYIESTIGNMAIEDFTQKEAQELFAIKLENVSAGNKKTILAIIRKIFDHAIREEVYIKSNPFSNIKIKETRYSEERNKPFKLKEVKQILHYVSKIDEKDSKRLTIIKQRMSLYLHIAFYTGLRTGELMCLKYEDIDIENNIININKTIFRNEISIPKTKNSARQVEIIKPLRNFLITLDLKSRHGFIFKSPTNKTTLDNEVISLGQLGRDFKVVINNIGLEQRTLYSTRHTFASIAVSHGEEITWIAQMLGHKDALITFKNYAKYIKSNKERGLYFCNTLNFEASDRKIR